MAAHPADTPGPLAVGGRSGDARQDGGGEDLGPDAFQRIRIGEDRRAGLEAGRLQVDELAGHPLPHRRAQGRDDPLARIDRHITEPRPRLGLRPLRSAEFSHLRLGIDLQTRVLGDERRTELRRLFGIPEDRFVIGWLGRMTTIKRVQDVIACFAALRRRGVEATLCLVGDGPDREPAERLAHELGVMRDVLFVGYQRDVAPYYEFIDALVLTSANEGTPVVAIEALAAGKPVVSTRVGGVPDVVEEGEDGLLVDARDVEGLAAALERLAGDRDLRARLGEHGRERVVPRYRVERLVDDTDRLYRELLTGVPWPSA